MWHGKLHLCNRGNTYLINDHKVQQNTPEVKNTKQSKIKPNRNRSKNRE